jgi:hypothetical protein
MAVHSLLVDQGEVAPYMDLVVAKDMKRLSGVSLATVHGLIWWWRRTKIVINEGGLREIMDGGNSGHHGS